MMGRLRILAAVIGIWLPNILWAQQKVDTLKGVEVVGEKSLKVHDDLNKFGAGIKHIELQGVSTNDKNLLTISELLQQHLPVYINTFGVNGAATLQLRGASAQQTQIVWKGIALNNAATGLADIGIINGLFHENITLVYGGSAALYGSGQVGGALLLANDAPVFALQKKSGKLALGIGSFGQQTIGISLQENRPKTFYKASAFVQKMDNNFPIYSTNGTRTTLQHAYRDVQGLQLEAAQKIGKGHAGKGVLSESVWLQKSFSEIPAALFETSSTKQRSNQQLRSYIGYDKEKATNNMHAHIAFLQDQDAYSDRQINLASRYKSQTTQAAFSWEKKFGEMFLYHVSTPAQFTSLRNDTNRLLGTQYRYGIVQALSYKHHRLSSAINFRVERQPGKTIVLPGINFRQEFSKQLQLSGNFQRTYRQPTLNELYFFPGGNINLRPERGWNADIGLATVQKNTQRAFQHEHRLDGFYRNLKDWIAWFGGSIWTPHNIATVQSLGAETYHSAQFKKSNTIIKLQASASFVKATTMESELPNDKSIGKQIPNTPEWVLQFSSGVERTSWYARVNLQITDKRFVTTDESQFVPGYQLLNMQLGYKLLLAQEYLQVQWSLNNLLNNPYQVVAGRPMPGFNTMFSLLMGTR